MNWEKHFRNMKRTEFGADAGFGGIMLASNLNAVNDYFHRTKPVTPEAKRLVSDWAAWWISTGSPDNYTFLIPDEVWDEARNRRLAFDRANAVTPEQKAKVEEVALTGMTTEGQRNEPERRDPITGGFATPDKPLIPTWAKQVVVGAVVLAIVGPIAKKFLPF